MIIRSGISPLLAYRLNSLEADRAQILSIDIQVLEKSASKVCNLHRKFNSLIFNLDKNLTLNITNKSMISLYNNPRSRKELRKLDNRHHNKNIINLQIFMRTIKDQFREDLTIILYTEFQVPEALKSSEK